MSSSRSYVDRKVKISLLTKQIIFIVCTTFFYILKIVFLLLIGYIVPIQSQIVIFSLLLHENRKKLLIHFSILCLLNTCISYRFSS